MSLSGIVNRIEINSSQLECCVEFDFGSRVGHLNCYMVLGETYEPYNSVNEVVLYVEDDVNTSLKVGDKKELKLSIIFGNNYSKVDLDTQESVTQPINRSSHTKFVATVRKIIDEYTIICSIEKLGKNILVDLEEVTENLDKEDRIKFSGEIKAELSK